MTDYKQELFDTWAPATNPWSAWAKPSLFAQFGTQPDTLVAREVSAAFHADIVGPLKKLVRATTPPKQAVVVDLYAEQTMRAAAQLARAGYRPVPLFNTTWDTKEIVDVNPILDALAPVAEIIRAAGLDDSAPPAFLLDANRNPWAPDKSKDAGKFDNRWLVFPQDFPSAEFLKEHGIAQILLCTAGATRPADDLTHVLLRWQEAGLPIFCALADNDSAATPFPLTVEKPPEYRSWLRRLLVMMKFRHNSAGGFGAIIPEPGSGGGWG